uniref:Uncharacterized protein n=1 Tax=Callorhinchus milii TaxID=7868 RepID=A0A4W3H4E1_CALMI
MSDMKQPVREPLQRRRSLGPMSPNHVKRLYRNLSFRLKGNSTSDETGLIKKTDKDRNRKASSLSVHYNSVFDAVENGDIDAVQRLLGGDTTRDGLNGVSTEGLVPLDIALLTNNVPMARLLMKAGAKFNHFSLDECQWVSRLAALVLTAENKVRELSEHSGGPPDPDWQRNRRERHAWRLRHRLWRQMRSVFENARVPEPPANVCLLVSDTNSLSVTFQEPPKNNSLIVTRYRGNRNLLLFPLSSCSAKALNSWSGHSWTSRGKAYQTALLNGKPWFDSQHLSPKLILWFPPTPSLGSRQPAHNNTTTTNNNPCI